MCLATAVDLTALLGWTNPEHKCELTSTLARSRAAFSPSCMFVPFNPLGSGCNPPLDLTLIVQNDYLSKHDNSTRLPRCSPYSVRHDPSIVFGTPNGVAVLHDPRTNKLDIVIDGELSVGPRLFCPVDKRLSERGSQYFGRE